jgi:xylose isomerase
MPTPNRPRYAARLNAFAAPGGTVAERLQRAAGVGGLDAADLNFPDHFARHGPEELGRILSDCGMALNGLAMRYYSEPAFRLGAFTHPDRAVRRRAIDLTRRGIDACRAMGGRLVTVWLGQDGVDYPFQGELGRMWDDTVAALAEVAAHDPAVDIAVEYKPNEPRAFALLGDVGTTLLALAEAGAANLGVTLDFAHSLYAGELPAHAAALIARRSRLLGVHLNDGYGRRDDGLIAGAIHPVPTLELLVVLERIGYDGVIYFDTFPDHGGMDPVAEARANIALVERLRAVAAGLARDPDLASATARQDAAAAMRIAAAALYGAGR